MKILGMGTPELLIILVVVLLIFGPKNLPKLGSAIGKSMKGLRDLVDVDCIVGKPIVTASGTTIIPISKVTFGFGSGGSDIAKSQKDDFGGAAGVTIQPLCFLIEREGDVRILNVNQNRTTADAIVNMVPEAIDRISAAVSKAKAEPSAEPPVEPSVEQL